MDDPRSSLVEVAAVEHALEAQMGDLVDAWDPFESDAEHDEFLAGLYASRRAGPA